MTAVPRPAGADHGPAGGPRPADVACAAALVGLPGMTPVRLARLLDGRSPSDAWAAVVDGSHPAAPGARWSIAAVGTDPAEVADRYRAAGVEVLLPADPRYPARLAADPGAPAVLLCRGDPRSAWPGPAVAIVGTRAATPYGEQVAAELGRDLAAAGVAVVSGLALGIDAAAHAGVLAAGGATARPVAVAGTGLDVPYPRANARLWEGVAGAGAVLAEAPLGAPPRRGAFPARNRIIAALSDVVVVVECHLGGGALHTVEAAARRGIPVVAVPGSVRSAASRGTNGLLVDGCAPVRDVHDVLVAVSLARTGRDAPAPAARSHTFVAATGRDRRTRAPEAAAGRGGCPVDGAAEAAVWSALAGEPRTSAALAEATGLSVVDLARACRTLLRAGAVVEGPGWWCRRG